jgi:acyl carrier protein
LKPFALSEHKIERWFGMDIPDSYNVVSQWVTVGDLRAAAAALKETGDE